MFYSGFRFRARHVTVDDLVANYIGLTAEHIRPATAHAAALFRRDELVYSA
jgi:hypothetical protein